MMRNFSEVLKHTLVEEGGFSDHPAVPGGATMKGITLAVYREYKRNPHLTPTDLRIMREFTPGCHFTDWARCASRMTCDQEGDGL